MNSGDTVEPTTALRRGEEDGEMGMIGRRLGVERNRQKGGQGPGRRPAAWLTSRLHSDTLPALCRPLGSLLHVTTAQTDGPIHTCCGDGVPHARLRPSLTPWQESTISTAQGSGPSHLTVIWFSQSNSGDSGRAAGNIRACKGGREEAGFVSAGQHSSLQRGSPSQPRTPSSAPSLGPTAPPR